MVAKARGAVQIIKTFHLISRRIYLFGTSKKLKFEIERAQVIRWYIILPTSRFRITWNIIIFFLLIYTATIVPYTTIFVDEEDSNFAATIGIIVDTLYFCDLILNFFMAYEDRDKKIEIRLKKIASNYLQSWFLPDLASIIPFNYLDPAMFISDEEASDSQNVYMMLKVLKLLKLVRLMKYSRNIKKIL
jgi:hypothetical protein